MCMLVAASCAGRAVRQSARVHCLRTFLFKTATRNRAARGPGRGLTCGASGGEYRASHERLRSSRSGVGRAVPKRFVKRPSAELHDATMRRRA
eukprot:2800074-Prymnesium_polylepis.1